MSESLVTRRCYICKSIKPIDEFVKRKGRPFGRDYCCSKCKYEKQQQWRIKNRDKTRAYCIKYTETHREELRQYRLKNKERRSEWKQEYERKNEQKVKVRHAFRKALSTGKMIPPANCSNCNASGPVQGHHHLGYAWKHRFDVIWLCRKCHMTIHRKPLEYFARMASPLWNLVQRA